jgi:hypothetical protein
MCAPRDQRKSSYNQREQAELNALQCQRRADVSGEVISLGKPRICADHVPTVCRRMSGYGMAARGARSGHWLNQRCPVRATFGLTRRSKAYRYSIISSALASTVGNGEADWRFGIDIDSNLVGCRTEMVCKPFTLQTLRSARLVYFVA